MKVVVGKVGVYTGVESVDNVDYKAVNQIEPMCPLTLVMCNRTLAMCPPTLVMCNRTLPMCPLTLVM